MEKSNFTGTLQGQVGLTVVTPADKEVETV